MSEDRSDELVNRSRDPAARSEPRALGDVDLRTRVRIAHRYFLDQRTKVQIADEFGLTRFQIARIVQECLDDGTVTITIRGTGRLDEQLAQALCDRFGIEDAIVVDDLEHIPGEHVASVVEPYVGPDAALAVDWNPAIGAVLRDQSPLPSCDVVQSRGVSGLGDRAVATVTQLAAACSGPAFPIFAPFLSRVAADAQTLRDHPLVEIATDRFERVGCAVLTADALDDPRDVAWNGLVDAERAQLRRAGVVASLGASLLGADGREVADRLTGRCIGMSRQQLHRTPRVVVVDPGGENPGARRAALRAALSSGLAQLAVTDVATARALVTPA